MIQIQKMNAARGWLWVKQGYQLIMRNPLLSISLALLGSLAMILTLRIPMVGPIIGLLLMPVLITGYMRVCRALEEDETVQPLHLLAGFQQHTGRLIALGGVLMLGVLTSSIVMILVGGSKLANLLETVKTISDPQLLSNLLQTAGPGIALSILLGLALMFLLMLAFQYAPMLVFFNNMPPLAAFRASLAGTLRNFIPYSVYSIIMQAIALVFSMLPYNIGMIILLPLGFTSLYVSYRNIFPFKDELDSTPLSEPAI